MAKEAVKSLSKKELREAANRRAKEVADLIKAANAASNPLEALPSFQAYHRNGLSCSVRYFTPATLPPALLDWCFALVKSNMEELYKPVWGWSDRKKRSELADEASRFIIAFEEGDEARPVAFVNARFDREDGAPVVYCYELQLTPPVQRKGLGRLLMAVLELISAKAGMEACLLTVMRDNAGARALYAKMGYVLDESSPGFDDPAEDCGYMILSKQLKRIH